MKLIICGGRSFDNHGLFDLWMGRWVEHRGRPSEVITGGASGADALGKRWAVEQGISQREFPADWNRHGRAAGPIRNQLMADYAAGGGCIAFEGGRGTADMVRRAEAAGCEVRVIR